MWYTRNVKDTSPSPNGKKRILLVEDEKPLSNALKMKLIKEGYDVTIAEDGEEALNQTRAKKFDLILLDIIMPKMDGFTLLELLQKAGTTSSQAVVVLSNLGQDDDIKRAKELGVNDYMVKANSPIARILDKVHSILE
jgi:DNA-binding response OmpR family regulator